MLVDRPELPQDAELIEVGPVLDDPAVDDLEEMDLGPLEALAVGRNPHERTLAGGVDYVAEHGEVAFGDHILHVNVHVGQGGTRSKQVLPEPVPSAWDSIQH